MRRSIKSGAAITERATLQVGFAESNTQIWEVVGHHEGGLFANAYEHSGTLNNTYSADDADDRRGRLAVSFKDVEFRTCNGLHGNHNGNGVWIR